MSDPSNESQASQPTNPHKWERVIAIGGLLGLAVLILQWCQLRDTVRIDERAWVTVESAKLISSPALEEAPVVTVNVRNSGKSPALKMKAPGGVYIATRANIADRDRPTVRQFTEFVVGPNSPQDMTYTMPQTIDDQGKPKTITINENEFLYVMGTISYSDIFKKMHTTHFCLRWNPKKAPPTSPLVMWFAETGNDAD